MYKEIFVVLCMMAVVMVHAYPAEDIESQQPVEQVAFEDNSDVEADLEGSESRHGYGRRYGGRGYGGYGGYGGYRGGYGGYGGRGYGGYGGGYGGYGGGYGRRHYGGYGGYYG